MRGESMGSEAEPAFESVALCHPFYQDAAFFPMPVVMVATVSAEGEPNLGPYSLCFPQPERGEQALLLICKHASKTAVNIAATGECSLCFLLDDPGVLDATLALARRVPSAVKMAHSRFTWTEHEGRPVVTEAAQVFLCSLVETTVTGGGEHHLLLRVDQALLQPRWCRALGRGWGAPRLAVEYGFRGSVPRWLSRPRAVFEGPALRPRFELTAQMSAADALASIARALEDPSVPLEGIAGRDSAQINIPAAEANLWSPELQIRVDELDGRARVRGRVGPHPHVWMLFVALQLLIALLCLGATMFGVSQLMVSEQPRALLLLPALVLLSAFVAGGAFIGQGLGAAHVFRLRAFVDEALER